MFSIDKSRHSQEIRDLSRKGDVDLLIRDVVQLLNECERYFTTSSCSGRIILFSNKIQDEPKSSSGSQPNDDCNNHCSSQQPAQDFLSPADNKKKVKEKKKKKSAEDAWAAYYAEMYGDSLGSGLPQALPSSAQPSSETLKTSAPNEESKPAVDYVAAWADYYRCLGMTKEAEMIEQQAKTNQQSQATQVVSGKRQKKGCHWVYVSHEEIATEALTGAIEKCVAPSMLKFEPFILHVRCESIEDAKKLLAVSIQSGFRNSGISIGKANRITLAVRSCLCLEVPISPAIPLPSEYLDYIVETANQKMKENMEKIERFTKNVQALLQEGVVSVCNREDL